MSCRMAVDWNSRRIRRVTTLIRRKSLLENSTVLLASSWGTYSAALGFALLTDARATSLKSGSASGASSFWSVVEHQ